ncbi:hypothetical protein Y032_0076g1037 [Ancylostoma ceylanicum]|uniref:Uncharacterized protein n=1 Tax=Ancylostoma ceylanicum TaxID=53326 RepID=A0A016TTN2_9BILA|nr:hypothetical protein Y032_0076g1037 [Ancylostoma ceylanicum]
MNSIATSRPESRYSTTTSPSTSGEGFDKATLCRRNYSPPPSRTSCEDWNGTIWECELTARLKLEKSLETGSTV